MEKIFNLFFENPEKEYYVRQVARIISLSPARTSHYLKKAVEEKILLSKKISNHLFFLANLESPNFREMKKRYNLDKLKETGLVDYIKNSQPTIEVIMLFGSTSKGEDNEKSDIDLMILGSTKKEIGVSKFEKKLGRKIQIFSFSKEDIKKMKKENPGLLNNIINGTILFGFWEVFDER